MSRNPIAKFSVDQLRSYSNLIKGPLTKAAIAASGVDERFVFGSIVWEKTLGRPQSAKLADGFAILLSFETKALDRQTGVDIPMDTPLPVTAWDGPADERLYRVYFVHGHIGASRSYRIDVKDRKGVRWAGSTLSGTWIRHFVPAQRAFTKESGPVRLEPIEIIAKPFIAINP